MKSFFKFAIIGSCRHMKLSGMKHERLYMSKAVTVNLSVTSGLQRKTKKISLFLFFLTLCYCRYFIVFQLYIDLTDVILVWIKLELSLENGGPTILRLKPLNMRLKLHCSSISQLRFCHSLITIKTNHCKWIVRWLKIFQSSRNRWILKEMEGFER